MWQRYYIFQPTGHRGLVGLFVNNKFMRCQGSKVHIPALPLSFISRKKNHKTTKVSRQEEIEKHAGVVAQERREEEEEPAGGSGMVTRIGSVRFEDD